MHQSIGTRLDNLRRAPRCGATTRVGAPCQCPAMRGRKRCRLHGGISPGAPRGAQNGNFRDGTWTAEGSRNAGGFGRLFGPSASLKTHHDNKKQYSEWSGCQCRALPSRTSQVAAHQRGSGESTPARRRDQGLVERLKRALGTSSSAFVNSSLVQLQAAARLPFGGISETAVNAARCRLLSSMYLAASAIRVDLG